MSYPSARNGDAEWVVDSRVAQRRIGVRPLALLLAMLFQLPVMLFFAPPKRSGEIEMPLTQLIILDRPQPERRVEPPSVKQLSVDRNVERSIAIQVSEPSLAPILLTDREPPDWNTSAAAAAQAAVGEVIHRESYQPLGPRDQSATSQRGSPPSVFETPKNNFGMIDQAEPGVSTIWLSENCYIQVGKSITPRASDSPRIPRCFVPLGRKKARGDLFKDMDRDNDDDKDAEQRLP